ncbi:MAG TPA: hypothetical protein DDW65_08640 [Firmicutes bacterium]|nr:hypothetical protein [Bacillota bacterium]
MFHSRRQESKNLVGQEHDVRVPAWRSEVVQKRFSQLQLRMAGDNGVTGIAPCGGIPKGVSLTPFGPEGAGG